MTNSLKKNSFRPVILLLILLSTALPEHIKAQADSTVGLETLNSFPGQWCCVNGGYLYGAGLNTRLYIYRKPENGQAIERRAAVTSLDPSFTVENRIYGTSIPGMIFVLVKNSLGQHFLLKSTDGGATIRNVFAFGQGNGPGNANAINVRMLRGLLELGRDLPGGGGKGTLFIGEYNVNSSRIAGSTNDRVRIMKSTDNGETWTKVAEWNTNGTNQVGHIHAMRQDPYTGEIYICFGDYESKLGIVKWNGSSPWADNRTLAQIGAMNGFKVFTGFQRYRVCDVLFDENYFYTFADTQGINSNSGNESGIWRGKKDFSEYLRMDNQTYSYDPMHVGWFGAKIGTTFIFTTAREYMDPLNAWKQLNTLVYTSTDGIHWNATGILGWRDLNDPTLSKYTANVFTSNDKLYIDCYGGAGHSSTIQCVLKNDWKPEEGPVLLHPVYFMGKWNAAGNDANPGTNADLPKASLRSLLTGNHINACSRIRVSAGTFNETGIDADWSVPVFNGRGSVIVEGKGMDSTKFTGQGAGNLSGIRIDSAKTFTNSATPFVMKNLEYSVAALNGTNHLNYVLDIGNTYVNTIRCRIGNSKNDDSPLVHLRSDRAKYVSVNSFYDAGEKAGIYRTILTADAASSISFINCLLLNAYNALPLNHENVDLSLVFSTFASIEHSAVILSNKFNRQPVIKNCLFSTGSAPIEGQSGIVENQVDYNYYSKPNINITDGGHSVPTGTDPLFVNSSNGDFRIYANSPCANAGIVLQNILSDITGKIRHNPPSIGAFEAIDQNANSGNGGNPVDTTNTNGNGGNPVDTTGTNGNGNKPPDSTGINNQKAEPVKIYPNPVRDYLIIENNGEAISRVIVYDMSGKMYLKENPTSRKFMLDFSGYARGIYVVEITSSSKATRKIKIIKD